MGQTAGLGTDTLAFSKALYLPLLTIEGPIGVLRIQPRTQELFTPEQMILLESCVNQVALALDVDRAQENIRKKELKIKTERARITLLEAISNDLNTPLKIIVSAAIMLKESDGEKTKLIGKHIEYEVEKLSQLNNNIMRIIQLEFQEIKVQKTRSSLNAIIKFVVKVSNKTLEKRPVRMHLPKNIPPVSLDEGLIQEVLINLIDNAVKFTPPESPITIVVCIEQDKVVVSLEDSGPGIALEERDKLFEKFYRGKQLTSVRGLGLGLAICHKIIVAHGGSIWVENLEKRGAAFRFALPLRKG